VCFARRTLAAGFSSFDASARACACATVLFCFVAACVCVVSECGFVCRWLPCAGQAQLAVAYGACRDIVVCACEKRVRSASLVTGCKIARSRGVRAIVFVFDGCDCIMASFGAHAFTNASVDNCVMFFFQSMTVTLSLHGNKAIRCCVFLFLLLQFVARSWTTMTAPREPPHETNDEIGASPCG